VHQDVEEDDHTTQVQITGPRNFSKAIQAFLPRRLTRSQSVNIVTSRDANMMIDVSVEKATVEAQKSDQLSQANVHLGRRLPKKPSTLSMSASSPPVKSWIAKAKDFTRKFRRTKNLSGPADPIPPCI
jgi:hypothetical protein